MVESFILQCDEVNTVVGLRGLRNAITEMIVDLKNPYFTRFNVAEELSVGDFLEAEKNLMLGIDAFNETLEGLDSTGVDPVSLNSLLEDVRRRAGERISPESVTEELEAQVQSDAVASSLRLVDESSETVRVMDETLTGDKISYETLAQLTLYIGLLHTKYAEYRPEVLHDGTHVPEAKWDYHATDRSITGRLTSRLFNQLLRLEAQWTSSTSLQQVITSVQVKSQKSKKPDYMCLCFIREKCQNEIRNWIEKFIYPNIAVYFYELNSDLLIYNHNNPIACHYEFWFNQELNKQTLYEQAMDFIVKNKYFTSEKLANELKLKPESAEKLIRRLEQKKLILDVSFKNDTVRRYTKR